MRAGLVLYLFSSLPNAAGCIDKTYRECVEGELRAVRTPPAVLDSDVWPDCLAGSQPAGNMRWVRLPTCFASPAATDVAPGGKPLLMQVKYVASGMPIFLFNYNAKASIWGFARCAMCLVSALWPAVQMLHGIFVATTSGQMNINPRGAL